MNDNNSEIKIINIGFNNEKIDSCINPEEIFEALKDIDMRDNLEKCLNSGSKIFSH